MRALRLFAIVCAALVFGLTLSHVLQSPGSRGLPPGAWLEVQHTFYGGFAVVGGVAEIVGLLAALMLAVWLWRSSRASAAATGRTSSWIPPAIAGLALFGTLVAYWVGNRPVNAKVATWTNATLPADWSSYRAQWENAHAVSALLSAVAFLALLVPVVWSAGTPAQQCSDRELPVESVQPQVSDEFP